MENDRHIICNLNPNTYQLACVLTHNLFWSDICYLITECTPGYTGPNCTSSCPYPTYGDRCQGYCDCTNVTCDVSKGCLHKGICYHRLYQTQIKATFINATSVNYCNEPNYTIVHL